MNQIPASPLRIAIMHGQLTHGGSERQLYLFLEQCDRARWQPHLFLSGESGVWAEPIQKLGVPITLLRGNPAQKMWRFRQECRTIKAQRFLSWGAYTNVYAVALQGLGIPAIGSFRNAAFADLPERGRRFWSWFSLAGLAAVVCNSPETLAVLQAKVKGRRSLLYVPNGVHALSDPTRHRSEWRQRLGLTEESLLVVGVGRLAPQKNFARFVDAVVLANGRQPIHAVIAGPDLGLKESLQRQVAAAGLPPGRIRIIDPVPDARALICAADIYLLSSDYEGMPNVVLEAMAAGVPSVCTPVNGVEALIEHGCQGWIARPDAAALAAALLRLADDPNLRHKMGANARQRVRREYDPATVYPRLWDFCEKMGG
jgi:glycosyltransferase involved in cell wall biosynthesis